MSDRTLPRPWSLARKLTVAYVGTTLLGVTSGAIVLHNLTVLAAHIDAFIAVDTVSSGWTPEHIAAIADARSAMRWMAVTFAVCGTWTCGLAVLLVRMVTSLRRRQAELREYVERVECSNQDLDAFAGRIAHDMRNLLAPMVVVPSLLRRALDVGPPHPATGAISRAADGIERRLLASSRLIDALLAFSRGSDPDDEAWTPSVVSVVEEVLDELEPLRERVGASIDRHFDDAPAQCAPGLLHVLVLNLVSNAIKFLESRPRRHVRVACARSIDGYSIEVQDSGPGIPPEYRQKVFEPFYRVPGVCAAGYGIGLATVRRIVQAHGGALNLDSTLGAGTTIRVHLPGRSDRPTPRPKVMMPARPPEPRL